MYVLLAQLHVGLGCVLARSNNQNVFDLVIGGLVVQTVLQEQRVDALRHLRTAR